MFKQAKWGACLVGALFVSFLSQAAMAGPLTNTVVTGSYAVTGLQAGQSAHLVGGDVTDDSSLIGSTPGGLITAVKESDGSYAVLPDGSPYQLYWLLVDETGLVTVSNLADPLAPSAPASQVVTLSFTGLTDTITSFLSNDLGGILSVIDAQTVSLDLSGISWSGLYATYSAQIGFAPVVTVPEPGALTLLALALLGVQLARRARA